MPVAFEELEGSPRLRIAEEGITAQRVFRVAWSDWQAFACELIGSYRVVGDAFVFTAPLEFPGMPNLLVSEVEVEPFDPASPDGTGVSTLRSTPNQYTAGGARVTATYVTTFDVDNQPRTDLPVVPNGTYLTYRGDLGAEYLHTPGRVWRWKDPPTSAQVPDDVNPGLLIPQDSFSLTWHRVALPPWSTIRALRGKVNAAPFLGAPAGTVLFLGAKIKRKFQFVEDGGFWEVAYAFQENTKELSTGDKVGWNFFYKETAVSSEHWVAIEDADENPPYLPGDLTLLFLFGS
jgi:hypothetical protein